MEVNKFQRLRYLERRKHDVKKCEIYLKDKNYKLIEIIGHNLGGNGKTFGLPELSTLGHDLEKYARKKDFLETKKHLNLIDEFINSIH